jgi:iron complex outermembrane receptor protein
MFNKKLFLAVSFLALFFSQPSKAVIGPIKITLNPIELSSNYFNEDDVSAPFASEVYSAEDIQNSKTDNIFDFLTQNTSLSLAPSSGNKFSQKISMRGYGLTVGSANLVITLNGRRLNNIDMSGSDINTININDIEKIEITKGSGSVVYGDSAMAGTINLYTKTKLDNRISTRFGNYGLRQTSAEVGLSGDKLDLNISIDNLDHGGYGVSDPKGNRDKGEQSKSNINFRYVTNGGTEFEIGFDKNDLENRYPNHLTKAQFDENPSYNSTGRVYTMSEKKSDTLTYKVKRQLSDRFSLSRSSSIHNKETITKSYDSTYGAEDITNYGEPNKLQYDYNTADYILTFKNGNLKIDSGYSTFNGSRTKPTAPNWWDEKNTTSKKNSGLFTILQYSKNDTTLSIGARNETVKYEYKNQSGSQTDPKWGDSHNLEAYDVGLNKRLNSQTTFFTNFNQAFQAPLIDRFFKSDGTFNGFMSPSTSKTLNLGFSHLTDKTKSKATIYRSNVSNEMYLNSSYENSNLDESHKQGLELQNLFVINPKWSTNLNYAYTDAKIDKESDDNGALNGKTNPMTSRHNISASLIYSISDRAKMRLTQKYRSSAFAEEDYKNIDVQKQKAFNSTDFNFSYNTNNNLEFNLEIENLFENSYGTWLRKDVIYPGNFTRNIKAGLSYKF